MVMPKVETNRLSEPKVPSHYIWSILLGFSFFHVAQSIFWQFGSYYLFAGIGETAFFLIGLVGGLPVLIGLAGVYLWGSLSDRWHRRLPFIIIGFLAQSITFFLYIFIQDSFSFLLVTCIAYLFSIATIPMATAYLTEARRLKGGAVGLLLSTSSLGWAVGAFAGGFLFSIIGMAGLFLLGAIAYFVGALIILFFVREITPPINAKNRDNFIQKPDTSSEPSIRRKMWVIVILAIAIALGSIGLNSFTFFFGVYLVSEIGGYPLMIGIANGFAAIVGLGVTIGAGYSSDRVGRKPVILFGFAGYTIFMIVYLFIFDPWLAMLLWIIPLYPLIFTASYAIGADVSKIERRGRAMSTITTANSMGAALGPIIGGSMVQFLIATFRGNMILAVILNTVAFFIVLVFVPETLKRARNKQ